MVEEKKFCIWNFHFTWGKKFSSLMLQLRHSINISFTKKVSLDACMQKLAFRMTWWESLCLPRRSSMETGESLSTVIYFCESSESTWRNLSETNQKKKYIFPLKSSSTPVSVNVSLTFSFLALQIQHYHTHTRLCLLTFTNRSRFHLRNKP